MADQMNFGPEWLRNLSSEGSTTGAPKYQLAEFRYGREEMLALFDRNAKPPEALKKTQGLLVEKWQIPIALIPMGEEESRAWNRGINSEPGLRNGKAPAGPPGMVRGRGGSVDRGRGRGRGSGFYYTRPGGFDDQDILQKDGPPPERTFLRSSRSFDRTALQIGERGWPERNGDAADWNGSTSPRKEFSGMMRGGGMDNWRRNRGGGSGGGGGSNSAGAGDDEDGWRQRDKWSRSSSWREEGEPGADGGKGPAGGRSSNWGRGWADEGVRGRGEEGESRRSHNMDDVPEWATADNHEPSGSFDSSGAFHGSHSDEDEGHVDGGGRRGESARVRLFSEGPEGRKSGPDSNRRPVPEPEPAADVARSGLTRSKTAAELGPPSNTSSSISKSASSVALSDAQSLDRIRAQHQNFVTKPEPDLVNDVKSVAPVMDKVHHNAPSPVLPQQVQPQISPTIVPKPVDHRKDNQPDVIRQSSEEDVSMSRLTVDSVVRLIEDEDKLVKQSGPGDNDLWFYRDPHGNEQGPFPASDMQSWYKQGYFQGSLLVRREHEQTYNALGDLMMLNKGRVPFFPPNHKHPSAPAAPIVDPMNFHLMGQIPQNVPKPPETDFWNSLSHNQREQFLAQRVMLSQLNNMPPIPNPVHFMNQLQQATMAHAHAPPLPTPDLAAVVEPLRQMMMAPPPHHLPRPVMTHIVPPPASLPHPMDVGMNEMKKEDIQTMLRKLETVKAGQRAAVDSLWSGPGRPINWTNGLTTTPQGMPPLWAMKKEEDILPEQQKLAAQQRAAEEEMRKQEEAKARKLQELKEEEERKERERESQEENKRLEEKKRIEGEETLRVMLGLPSRGVEARKAEVTYDLSQLQREKEENKKRMDEQRRKIEEMRRLEEAQRKKEEKDRRKEEERKRLAEEEDRRRLEAVAAAAAAEERERQEQQRRQEEALRCLKQQQLKSRMVWSQSTMAPASLAEIQAQEKEKKQQMQRDQSVLQQVLLQQAAEQSLKEAEAQANKSNGLSLKWAEQQPSRVESVKSLAEIQAEQQVQVAKQLEKDRQERALQQRDVPVNAGIWGSSNTGLSWNNHTSNNAPWAPLPQPAPPAAGFWDEAYSKTKQKTPTSPLKVKPQAPPAAKKVPPPVAKPAKPKAKRDEAMVLKLFEQTEDEFTNWCTTTLCSPPLQAAIDVPTFTTFLRDIESPFEVKDYIKTYLGDTKDTNEFARQFLERRSRWRSAQKMTVEEDDMCAPAPAVNPPGLEAQDPAKKEYGERVMPTTGPVYETPTPPFCCKLNS